ncbi:MAG: M23 family metallopeptidase, partial [Chloroflexota bacterium]|nr:M23 family metallopeptidase [Chloroflexota bacterium]
MAPPPQPAAANHTVIKMPFASGPAWTVGQGYNTSPRDNGTHYNCDPVTLKDQPSQSTSCRAHYQYKWSMDLARADGNTSGQTVLSPVNGTIRWTDPAFGGLSIDLGDGYAYALFHASLASGLAAGQPVRMGQTLGSVAPPGGGGNGGWPHLHVTLWQTTDGGNWSRNAVPFTGAMAMDGYDFPSLGETSRNQYWGRQIFSTNSPAGTPGGVAIPEAPGLVSPATGSGFTATNPTIRLSWDAVPGASEYQVVLNDTTFGPWVSATSYTTDPLATSQWAWQVRARNSSGTGPLSPK